MNRLLSESLFNKILNSQKMKKLLFISCSILIAASILFACKKNTADVTATEIITEENAVNKLNNAESFTVFSNHFIPDLSAFLVYHKAIKANKLENIFADQIRNANDEDNKLADAYQAVSLNYETAISLKNKIDNDILHLLNENKFLLKFDEEAVRRIIFTTLEMRMNSTDPALQISKEQIVAKIPATNTGNRIINGTFTTNYMALSLDEVWGCVKEALGVGSASILGIAGLQKLAAEGIQDIVIATSKWLAKRAGWIGAAVILIDFGSCIYKESND